MRLIVPLCILIVVAAASAASAPNRGFSSPQGRPTLTDSFPPLEFDGVENAIIGLYIEDIESGEAVAEYGSDTPLCPASIMKAVTSASAMSLYPDGTSFVTKVATRGETDGTTLCGDIVIYGSGDPTLDSDYFTDFRHALPDSIVSALRRAGIDSVGGSILIDQTAIPDPSYPPGWGDDDFMWPYGAMLRAFNWRDNRYTLEMPSKTTIPFIPGLKIDYTRRRGKMGYDAVPPLTTVKAWGRPPRRGASERLAMPDPAAAFIFAMNAELNDSGIKTGHNHYDYLPGIAVRELTEVRSPSFYEIMRSMMHRSDNLMAEGMMRTIAPRQPRDTAAVRELALWSLRGVDTDSVDIVDGSGLSRLNRVTTWFMADVMSWMARSPKSEQYVSLFPLVGRSGTVRRFLAGTPLEGKMRLKTGTMRGVRALAGFKLDDNGHPTHTVVLIVNRYSCPAAAINRAAESFFLNFFS